MTWSKKTDKSVQRYTQNESEGHAIPVNISRAHNGFWKSNAHHISLHYDENIWSIIDHTDSKQETFCALQDVKGGSSFALRIEHAANIHNMCPKEIESALRKTLETTDPEIAMTNRRQLKICDLVFDAVDYCLDNKLYGLQVVRHAYIMTDDYALLLLMAWPHQIDASKEELFPAKYLAFLNGLNLNDCLLLK